MYSISADRRCLDAVGIDSRPLVMSSIAALERPLSSSSDIA
jgi:hypothetical protein